MRELYIEHHGVLGCLRLEEEASGLPSAASAEPFGGSFTVTAPDAT